MELKDTLTIYADEGKNDVKIKADWLFDFIKGFTELYNASFWVNDIEDEGNGNGCAIVKGYMEDWDRAKFCTMRAIAKNVREWAEDVIDAALDHAKESREGEISFTVTIHDHEGYGGLTCVLSNDDSEYDKLMIIPTEK